MVLTIRVSNEKSSKAIQNKPLVLSFNISLLLLKTYGINAKKICMALSIKVSVVILFNLVFSLYKYELSLWRSLDSDILKLEIFISRVSVNVSNFFSASSLLNINKAIEWYEKSSELGYLSSTYRLACFYYSGEGVVQDFDRAFSYYSKVAESDGSCKDLARLHLGKCYYLGRGIDCDYVKARELFEEAARNNDLEAMYYLGEVYRLGLGVAVNENISFSYYTKVVELWREYNDGSYIDEVLALSCFYAGCFCMNGRGTSRNMVEAVKYWKIGAEHNDKECQRNLAIAYKNGNGVPCNIELANYWFNIANK